MILVVLYIDLSYFEDVITKYQYKDIDVRVSGVDNLEIASSLNYISRVKQVIFESNVLTFSAVTDEKGEKLITSTYIIPRNGWMIELSVPNIAINQDINNINILLLIAYIIAMSIAIVFNIQVVKNLMFYQIILLLWLKKLKSEMMN